MLNQDGSLNPEWHLSFPHGQPEEGSRRIIEKGLHAPKNNKLFLTKSALLRAHFRDRFKYRLNK
jgi:hypothetical protein